MVGQKKNSSGIERERGLIPSLAGSHGAPMCTRAAVCPLAKFYARIYFKRSASM